MSKIHRPIINGLKQIVSEVFSREGHQLDVTLERHFRQHKQWGGRDRRFIGFYSYEMVRFWGQALLQTGIEQAYQQTPLYNEERFWAVFSWLLKRDQIDLPPWPEFVSFEKLTIKDTTLDRDFVPGWLKQVMQQELGPSWFDFIVQQWERAPIYFRANSKLKKWDSSSLRKVSLQPHLPPHLVPHCYEVPREESRELLKKLQFCGEVQDGSSQQIAPLLFATYQKNLVWLDVCAGAGGKTLHLADLLDRNDQLLAYDLDPKKLQQLHRRLQKYDYKIQLLDEMSLTKLKGKVDRLLIDAPCSGLGVLRRHPDTFWHLAQEKLSDLWLQQERILAKYAELVNAQGYMLYATCSILPSENEKQIAFFLEKHRQWKKIKEVNFSCLISEEKFDGMYACLLQRT